MLSSVLGTKNEQILASIKNEKTEIEETEVTSKENKIKEGVSRMGCSKKVKN